MIRFVLSGGSHWQQCDVRIREDGTRKAGTRKAEPSKWHLIDQAKGCLNQVSSIGVEKREQREGRFRKQNLQNLVIGCGLSFSQYQVERQFILRSVYYSATEILFLDSLFLFIVMLNMLLCYLLCASPFLYKNILTWFNYFKMIKKFMYQIRCLLKYQEHPNIPASHTYPILSESRKFVQQCGKASIA